MEIYFIRIRIEVLRCWGQGSVKQLIINFIHRSKRMAILSNSTLEQVIYMDDENESLVGNIYVGTIERVLKGMNAAFVNIGLDQNGYLPIKKMAAYMQLTAEEKKHPQVLSSCAFVGKKVLVQVEADATKTKGPKVTELVELNEEDLVLIYQGNYEAISKKIINKEKLQSLKKWSNEIRGIHGILLRTSSEKKEIEELNVQWKNVLEKIEELEKKRLTVKNSLVKDARSPIELIQQTISKYKIEEVVVDDLHLKQALDRVIPTKLSIQKVNIFTTYGIDEQLAKALKRVVWLDNGAYLIIDELEALTIIDVNTGGYIGKNNLKETALKTNEWALKTSFEQMKLRNLSGMILIDFIEMDDEHRKKIEEEAILLAKKDETRVRVVGFTSLGILQVTRKKTAPSILEQTTILCPTCQGQARVKSASEVANELEREIFEYRHQSYDKLLIECSSDVAHQLTKKDPNWYEQFLQLMNMEICLEIKEKAKPYYEIRRLV